MFNNDFGEGFSIQSPDQEERRQLLEELITSRAAAEAPLAPGKQVRPLCISAFPQCKVAAIQSVLCGDFPSALLLVSEHQASANVVCWLWAGQTREALHAVAPSELCVPEEGMRRLEEQEEESLRDCACSAGPFLTACH